jgi:mRNA-binding protein PUF3
MAKAQYWPEAEKLLNQLEGADRDAFVEEMKPQFLTLKKGNTNGRQIAAIDRLIFAAASPASGTKTGTPASTAPASPALPVDPSSAAPTPNLTTESNSPSSSSPPSTGASATEETFQHDQKQLMTSANGNPMSAEVGVNDV